MSNWMPTRRATTYKNYKSRNDGPVTTFSYTARDAWSAAAAATRINGEYFKEDLLKYVEGQGLVCATTANKNMVRKMLEEGAGWTDEDVARGAEACAYWQGGLIKIMAGTANSFEISAISIAGKDTIESAYDLAVLSSLVASAERGVKRDEVNYAKSLSNSVFVGKVGEHFQLANTEVIANHFVQGFYKWRVEAKCEGNLYTWWSDKDYKAGDVINIKGKVKAHIVDRNTGAKVTQLNYVKEVK